LKNHAKDIPEVEKLTFSVKRPGPPQGEDEPSKTTRNATTTK
jgi:hypothetical protein